MSTSTNTSLVPCSGAVVIGGGPGGLFAAERLASRGVPVTLFDAAPTAGRKFLMAGRGGLNLTHSEPLPAFANRYGAEALRFGRYLAAFSPTDLRNWADGLGAETFVGSSGRIFPRALKASPLLRAWLRRLDALGVQVRTRHRWVGLDQDGTLHLLSPAGNAFAVRPRAALLALGGASWPRLGSDGRWSELLAAHGIPLAPFRPANCGFEVRWSPGFLARAEGQPLKNLEMRFGDRRVRGELVITHAGIEGGAVYSLSTALRNAIEKDGEATVTLDLRPQVTVHELTARLARPRGADSLSNWLRKTLGAGPLAALVRELAPQALTDAARLAQVVKALPLRLTGVRPIERAISSAGGIRFEALDDHLMLRAFPGLFAAGEMLDWEAPTGGYLLQGCFSTAARAAEGMLTWLARPEPGS